jgi:hypothetical protein
MAVEGTVRLAVEGTVRLAEEGTVRLAAEGTVRLAAINKASRQKTQGIDRSTESCITYKVHQTGSKDLGMAESKL